MSLFVGGFLINNYLTSVQISLLHFLPFQPFSWVRSHGPEKRFLISSCVSVRLSIYLSACIIAAPTGLISVKSGNGDFHDNLSSNSQFTQNRTKPGYFTLTFKYVS